MLRAGARHLQGTGAFRFLTNYAGQIRGPQVKSLLEGALK